MKPSRYIGSRASSLSSHLRATDRSKLRSVAGCTTHAAVAKLSEDAQMRGRWNALRLDLTLPHFVLTLSGNGFNYADRLGFGLAFNFFTHECSFDM